MKDLEKQIQSLINLYKSKKFTNAEELAKKLIYTNPKVVFLYNLLGLILNEQNKIDDAIKIFEKGIKLQPNYALIYNNLGTSYKIKDDYKNSESNYKKSIQLDNKVPETFNNLGNLYMDFNKYNDAIDCYKKAISINQNFFVSYYNLGIAYKAIGNFDDSKKNLFEAIKLNPRFFTAHRVLSQITKYNKDNSHFAFLQRLYEDKEIKNLYKSELAFALAKAHEDVKDYKKAFQYYNDGNYFKRKNIKFSIKEEQLEFNKIKKIFNKNIFKKFKDVGIDDTSAIFIIGMPRSGTTLIEQIISSHKSVYGGDELGFLPDLVKKYFISNLPGLALEKIADFENQKFDKIAKEYILKLKKISNNSKIVTDKLPSNFKWIGLIKMILPHSKIIHCIREPNDNCFSIFKNYFAGVDLKFAYDINEITHYYNLYFDLMNHWKEMLPGFIHDIKYEDLIRDPKKNVEKILNFCHLDWDEHCLEFYKNKRPVKTASDTQVRQKIYNTSINYWKNFEKYLKEPFQILPK